MEPPPHIEYREVLRQMQHGDWPAAAAACQRLTASQPDFAPGLLAASQIAARLGRPAQALECIDRALRLEPANARFHVQRALSLGAAGRWPEAFAAAAVAESHAASDPTALEAIGTVYSRGASLHR